MYMYMHNNAMPSSAGTLHPCALFNYWLFISLSFAAAIAAAHVKTYENDTVYLPCYFEDLGFETRVRWWRDGTLLADSMDVNIEKAFERLKMWDNSSLAIEQVHAEDAGEYMCQATRPDPWGQVTQIHEIQVMYPPSVHPVPESGEIEVNFGDNVDMSCVAKGIPIPSITWLWNGEELQLLDDRARLRFVADNRTLSGRYTCQASNGIGDPAAAHIDLKIKYKPEVQVKKSWIHAAPNFRAQLDCKIISWPEAKVEWFHKDEPVIYSNRKIKMKRDEETYSLIIRNVRPSDFGDYACRAKNSYGESEGLIELFGMPNPAVIKKESRPLSTDTYFFLWEVDSYTPVVDYQFWFRPARNQLTQKETRGEWRKLFIPSGNDVVGPVHTRSFNLTGLDVSTHYEALVLSRNRFGWSMPSKIIRFTTAQDNENIGDKDYEVEDTFEDTDKLLDPSVVQVASMSHQSSASTNATRSHIASGNFIVIAALIIFSFLIASFSNLITTSSTL